MIGRRVALALSLVGCGAPPALARSPAAAAAAGPAPTAGLEQVDWHNRTYQLTLLEGEGPMPFPVAHGRYVIDGEADDYHEALVLGPPVYGDVTGDGRAEALIELTYRNDDIGPFDRLDVFTGDAAGVRWLGLIHGADIDDDGAITGFRVVDGEIEVTRRGRPADRWRFDGRYFIEATAR